MLKKFTSTIKHHLIQFLSKVLNTNKRIKSKLVKLFHLQSHLKSFTAALLIFGPPSCNTKSSFFVKFEAA
jgi:hypothetical protein